MNERAAMWLGAAAGGAAAAYWLWSCVGLGYSDGTLTGLVLLVDVDGVLVERRAGSAFRAMQAAAAGAGVKLRLTSGFRTWAEQAELYGQYQRGERKAVVAAPGRSNHQRGEPEPERGRGPAVDIAVQSSEASPEYRWLASNARKFGFVRTVASEPWHWEYVGGGA